MLYSQSHDLVSPGVVCIGLTTNNIVKYHAVIGLLMEAASHDIDHLVAFMESQLVVSHLNHVYAIRNLVLHRLFQRVCYLKRSFETVTYQHVPISSNIFANSLANYMLDWYIAHS